MSGIGIVGGVGPMAGTDLANKVFLHTKAETDQDHINLFLTSCPSIIPDRTAYLLNGAENPASGIEKCIQILANCGASVVGISCNTAHSPLILKDVKIPESVRFINMIESTASFIKTNFSSKKVGLLSTLGTMNTGVYKDYFNDITYPDLDVATSVHDVIYNKEYGIKALSSVSEKAETVVKNAVTHLKEKGCDVVILGCTELPLVFNGVKVFNGVNLIDPTEILACELIRAIDKDKLK